MCGTERLPVLEVGLSVCRKERTGQDFSCASKYSHEESVILKFLIKEHNND